RAGDGARRNSFRHRFVHALPRDDPNGDGFAETRTMLSPARFARESGAGPESTRGTGARIEVTPVQFLSIRILPRRASSETTVCAFGPITSATEWTTSFAVVVVD